MIPALESTGRGFAQTQNLKYPIFATLVRVDCFFSHCQSDIWHLRPLQDVQVGSFESHEFVFG